MSLDREQQAKGEASYGRFLGTVQMMYADSDLPQRRREPLIASGHSAPALPAKCVYSVVKLAYS